MKNVEFLGNRALWAEQLKLIGQQPESVDIATYGVGKGHVAMQMLAMINCQVRLLIGGTQAESHSKAWLNTYHTWISNRKIEVRYCEGSHVKLFICYWKRRPTVVIGSQNLGKGSTFEAGVVLRGNAGHHAAAFFDYLWGYGQQIKSLNLKTVAAQLSTGSFNS